jgi:hypothetical protein
MRRMNRSLVLNTIRLEGPISRAQIARQRGLSAATVSDLVAELIRDDLVFEREWFGEAMFEAIEAYTMRDLGPTVPVYIIELENLAWARSAAGLVLRTVFHSPIYKQDINLEI